MKKANRKRSSNRKLKSELDKLRSRVRELEYRLLMQPMRTNPAFQNQPGIFDPITVGWPLPEGPTC